MAIALVQSIHNCELKIQISHLIPEVSFKQSLISDYKIQTYKEYMHGYYLIKWTVDWMIDAFLSDKDKQTSLICPIQYAYQVVLSNFPLTTLFFSSADPLIVCDERGAWAETAAGWCGNCQKQGWGQCFMIHESVMLDPIQGTTTAKSFGELFALYGVFEKQFSVIFAQCRGTPYFGRLFDLDIQDFRNFVYLTSLHQDFVFLYDGLCRFKLLFPPCRVQLSLEPL